MRLPSCILLTALLCSVLLVAQSPYGRVTGRITDSAGALAPGAGVTITNIDTNVCSMASSNGAGVFDIPNLTPGQYRMDVQLSGFKGYQRGPAVTAFASGPLL